ncbi:TPA: 6-oxopurine nucleoside phosphorylase [bacterium]|nr:6-oxopurine nucleoside phosphorylase [bacterium]
MNLIAVIGGMILKDLGVIEGASPQEVKTVYGSCTFFFKENIVFLPRHGERHSIPPHRVNHLANIASLKELGVEWIIGVNSVGSLKEAITPDYLLVPDDYINLWNIKTFYNEEAIHITPGLSEEVRRILISSLKESNIFNYQEKGVYIQTTGPRLETKAEIRMLKSFGDVVGMTMASEATAAKELGLHYASLCSIDNFCHGIGRAPLLQEEIKRNLQGKAGKIRQVIEKAIAKLGEAPKISKEPSLFQGT